NLPFFIVKIMKEDTPLCGHYTPIYKGNMTVLPSFPLRDHGIFIASTLFHVYLKHFLSRVKERGILDVHIDVIASAST
ncbi:hypothetical protein ACJX0J_039782, partial [Zea mays]